MKLCKKCANYLPLSAYHKNNQSKTGLRSNCKNCVAKRSKERLTNNKEIINAKRRKSYISNKDYVKKRNNEWRKRNPDKIINSRLKNAFGIDLSIYKEMLLKQNNACLICLRSEKEIGKKLVVDHSHITGMVRGLLCNNCNTAIGLLKENLVSINRVNKYLTGEL